MVLDPQPLGDGAVALAGPFQQLGIVFAECRVVRGPLDDARTGFGGVRQPAGADLKVVDLVQQAQRRGWFGQSQPAKAELQGTVRPVGGESYACALGQQGGVAGESGE